MKALTYTIAIVNSTTDSDKHFEIYSDGRFLIGGVVSSDRSITDERIDTMVQALVSWGELDPEAIRETGKRTLDASLTEARSIIAAVQALARELRGAGYRWPAVDQTEDWGKSQKPSLPAHSKTLWALHARACALIGRMDPAYITSHLQDYIEDALICA